MGNLFTGILNALIGFFNFLLGLFPGGGGMNPPTPSVPLPGGPSGGPTLPGTGLYNIRLVNTGRITRYDSLFRDAAARWELVIENDLFDVGVTGVDWFAGRLSATSQDMGIVSIDDLLIGYELRPESGIDLVGPTFIREDLTPLAGIMRFDSRPFENRSRNANLVEILREMGRVLGIGTLWGRNDANCNGGCSLNGEGGLYTCGQAAEAYQALRAQVGFTFGMAGLRVSDSRTQGDGCISWDDDNFDADDWVELMTSSTSFTRTALLTTVTLAALEDVSPSYVTNPMQADPIPLSGSAQEPLDGRALAVQQVMGKDAAAEDKVVIISKTVPQVVSKDSDHLHI